MLTLRDRDEKFGMLRDLLKMMTNKKYKVYFAEVSVKKLINNFVTARHFDVKAPGNKSDRRKSFVGLLETAAIKVFGLSIISSPENRNEFVLMNA